MHHKVVLIPGDGIGPEICAATKRVFAAAGADIEWIEHHAGLSAIEDGADTVLPESTLAAIRQHKVALKGPCTTPVGKGFRSVNVALRKGLHLYGSVRPVKNLPGVKTHYDDVDIVVIRENTEGLYAGIENTVADGVVSSLKVATKMGCTRIAKFAFEYARKNGRKKVTTLHKANIMKLSDGLMLECAHDVHSDGYTDVDYDEVIIDAGCMRIVQDPTQFDVLLCENLYGDIVSDLCSGLVGGLGVTPGANFGEDCAVFEAVHGSAPDIAGQNKANPLALISSANMMLFHLASTRQDPELLEINRRVQEAYRTCLEAGQKTGDLGGDLGTKEFTDAIISAMG